MRSTKCILSVLLFALSSIAFYPSISASAYAQTDCRFQTYNVYPSSVDSTKVTITGTTKDAIDNEPCANLFLRLFDPATTQLKKEARTDGSGNFTFTYDDPTDYSAKSYMVYLLDTDNTQMLDQKPAEFTTGIQPTPPPSEEPQEPTATDLPITRDNLVKILDDFAIKTLTFLVASAVVIYFISRVSYRGRP